VNRPEYRIIWQHRLETHRNSYLQILDEKLPEGVSRNPETAVTNELQAGLEAAYGGDRPLAEGFFRRCALLAKQTLNAHSLSSREEWPKNQGDVLHDLAIAEAFLLEAIDAEGAVQASRDFETWIGELERFDRMDRGIYLKAIRCALLAQATERALELIKTGWLRIRRHEEANLLKRLAQHDLSVVPELDQYFDRIRNPDPDMDVIMTGGGRSHALEIAALKAQLLLSNMPIDWWAAADQAAA
jgi:hypothetical protein